MAKQGLYANNHAKRLRIKNGSGEKMRKPGSAGAPTAAQFKRSAKTAKKKLRPIAIHQTYKLRTEKLTKEAIEKMWTPPRDDVVWL